MKNRILEKDKLLQFLGSLMEKYNVIAPVKKGDYSLYQNLTKADDLCLDFLRPLKSAKEIFFPQNETMFYFNQRTQKLIEAENPGNKTILFGAPPCDLAGIAAQDRLFTTGAFQDVYYLRRRKQTVLIGMGCPKPDETCFCHFFEIDRLASSIADLFFTPLCDRYYVEVQSEQGEKLAQGLPEASAADKKALDDLKNAPVEFSTEALPLKDVIPLLGENFDSPVWEEISKRCIGCAACTFVCPTCHCFDITDDVKKGLGRRVRTWDGCMFPKFTLHASGHNPRTAEAQRMRQRFLHKFSYFVDNQGVISCTGCGRCVAVCPVNMDIRETLKKLIEATAEPLTK